MKVLLSTIALLFTFSHTAMASSQDHSYGQTELLSFEKPDCSLVADCEEDDNDNYARVCSARDAQGHVYKYYLHWHEDAHVQRVALKKCRQNSARPETCRPMGCQRLN